MRQRHVGPDALARALSARAPVRVVIVRRGAGGDATDVAARAAKAGARVLVVSRAEISRLVGGGGTADVLAMSGPDPGATLDAAFRVPGAAWLLVDLAFPGNIGLALRTAEVSGAVAVAVAPALAGAARRSALRASIGAHRFLPVHWTTTDAALDAARAAGRRVVAMESSGTAAPWDVDLRGDVLLVAGGERDGIPRAVLDAADAVVRLPTAGLIPSYNVAAAVAAVAASVFGNNPPDRAPRARRPRGAMESDQALPVHEARLVEAARRGDRAAFTTLVRDAAPMLERLALRVLRHRQDAEDAAQEAILDAWRNLPRFRGDARFRTWVYRILVTRALDVARRRRPADEMPAAVASSAAGPAESAASRDIEDVIRDAISELPPAQRTVLLLRTDHGLSYEEISYVMGTGRDAVRMNLIEARRKLAQKLRGVIDLGGNLGGNLGGDREVEP